MAGDLNAGNTRDAFTELLLVDVVRGHHSTGVASVDRNHKRDVSVIKAPVPSFELILMEEYKKLIKSSPPKVLIGHNRWATMGATIAENAHPFEFDGLVGAHNGTLDKYCLKDLHQFAMHDTDSAALYSHIDRYGVQEAVNKITGAWALTWYDKRKDTINFLRNDKRPLYYTYSADRCTLFWASELEMLKWVLSRNHIRVFAEKVDGKDVDRFFTADENMHMSWKVPDSINKKFDKPTMIEAKRVYPAYKWEPSAKFANAGYHQGSRVLPFVPKKIDTTPLGQTMGQLMGQTNMTNGKLDTKKFRPPYKDANGLVLNKKKVEELISKGCVFCEDTTPKWGDFIYPMRDDLTGQKIFLCEECYNDDDIRELCAHIIPS